MICLQKTIPKVIKKHSLGWLLGPIWARVHNKSQQFSVAFVGAPGSGKSSAALSLALLMDRDHKGNTRFGLDRIAFTSSEFFDLVNSNLPTGSAIILDDAGLFAYSADALTR